MEKCTPGVYFFSTDGLCSRGSVTSGAPRPAPHAGSRGSANTETTEGSGGSLDGRNTSCLLVTNTTPSYAYGVPGKQGSGLTHAQVLVSLLELCRLHYEYDGPVQKVTALM